MPSCPREGTKNGHVPNKNPANVHARAPKMGMLPGGVQKASHPALDGPQPYPRR